MKEIKTESAYNVVKDAVSNGQEVDVDYLVDTFGVSLDEATGMIRAAEIAINGNTNIAEQNTAANENNTAAVEQNTQQVGNYQVKKNFGLDDSTYAEVGDKLWKELGFDLAHGGFSVDAFVKLGLDDDNIYEVEKYFVEKWNEDNPEAPISLTVDNFENLSELFTTGDAYKLLRDAGQNMSGIVIEGLNSGKIGIRTEAGEMVLEFADGTKVSLGKQEDGIVGLFKALGVDMSEGAIDGMSDEMKSSLLELAKIFGIPEEEAKKTLEISSPSKVFKGIGEYVIEGLVNGLKSIGKKLKGIWDALPKGLKTTVNKLVKLFTGMESDVDDIFDLLADDAEKNVKGLPTWMNNNVVKKIIGFFTGSSFKQSGAKAATNLSSGIKSVKMPTPKVDVVFKPKGDSGSENENNGLSAYLKKLVSAGADTVARVKAEAKEGMKFTESNKLTADVVDSGSKNTVDGSAGDGMKLSGGIFKGDVANTSTENKVSGKKDTGMKWSGNKLTGDVIGSSTENKVSGKEDTGMKWSGKKLTGDVVNSSSTNTVNGSPGNASTWNKNKDRIIAATAGSSSTNTVNGSPGNASTWNKNKNRIIAATAGSSSTNTVKGSPGTASTWNKNKDRIIAATAGSSSTNTVKGSPGTASTWNKNKDKIIAATAGSSSTNTVKGNPGTASTWNKNKDKIIAATAGSSSTNTVKGSPGTASTWNKNKDKIIAATDGSSSTNTVKGTPGTASTWNKNKDKIVAITTDSSSTNTVNAGAGTGMRIYSGILSAFVTDNGSTNTVTGATGSGMQWLNGCMRAIVGGTTSVDTVEGAAGYGMIDTWGSFAPAITNSDLSTTVWAGLAGAWGSRDPVDFLGIADLRTTIKAGLAIEQGKSKIVLSTDAHDKNTWTVAVQALGGIISAGGLARAFASGGLITGGGFSGWWNGIPKYAAGTRRVHGSMFVAGEAGPEIIGHINGRTEILNKSQLAQTMYGAVTGGMAAALRGLQFRMPAMATGAVIPYSVAEQIAKSASDLQNTMNANNEDLIQTIISVASQVVVAVNGLQEQQGRGVNGYNAQRILDDLNRRTQMFFTSPLKGV